MIFIFPLSSLAYKIWFSMDAPWSKTVGLIKEIPFSPTRAVFVFQYCVNLFCLCRYTYVCTFQRTLQEWVLFMEIGEGYSSLLLQHWQHNREITEGSFRARGFIDYIFYDIQWTINIRSSYRWRLTWYRHTAKILIISWNFSWSLEKDSP